MNSAQILIQQACEQWIQDLTDLSRRNNLLYYRDLKVGTLKLNNYVPEFLEDLLRGNKISINDLLALKDNDSEIYRKIKLIHKRSRQNLEERGIDTLLIAFGFVTWKPDSDNQPINAPLVLIPISIEAKSKIFLNQTGEIIINPVLFAYLEKNYNIRINPDDVLSADSIENPLLDFKLIIENFKKALGKKVPELQIDKQLILSNFSFQKMSMVEDIKFQRDNPDSNNELILAMAGNELAIRKLKEKIVDVDVKKFDDISPEEDFIIFDCDSSQQSVIQAVLRGENCTIQGPPGTGKSQTIANLISSLVANGKKVLFVAEKRAALEVVRKRLEEKKLGHLLLDLHGSGISRKVVMEEFKESLDLIRNSRNVDVGDTHKQFMRKRKELNYHVEQFHKKRMPASKSIYELHAQLLSFTDEEKSQTRFTGKDLLDLTPDVFDSLRNKLEDLQKPSLAELFLNTNLSPWQAANISSVEDAAVLSTSVNRIFRQLLFLEQEFLKLEGYGLTEYKSFKEIEAMIQLLEKVNSLYELYTDNPELFKLDLQSFLQIRTIFTEETELNKALELLNQISNAKDNSHTTVNQKIELLSDIGRTLDKYSERIYTEDIQKFIEILESANSKRWLSNFFDTDLKNTMEVLGKLRVNTDISREDLLKEIKKIFGQATEWKKLFFEKDFPDKKLITRLRANDFFIKTATPTFWKTFESIRSSRNPAPKSNSEFFLELEKIAEILKEWKTQHRASVFPEPIRGWQNIKATFAELKNELVNTKVKINQNHIERLPIGEIIGIFKELDSDLAASSVGSIKETEKEFNTHNANLFLLEIKKNKPNPEFWVRRFEYTWLMSCLEEAYRQDTRLKSFHGKTHSDIVKEYQELDQKRLDLTKERLTYRHARWIVQQIARHGDEENLIRAETNKKAARLSLRRLLQETPNLLTSLRPCWMASPLSISQLVDPKKQYFDVVIFDEASQIIPADAIPALMRSKQVVVAGDTRQLPPTDFFKAGQEEEETEDVSYTKGFESLLNRTASFLNERQLLWHYRSHFEELIAFSNENIYSNKLITFPSSRQIHPISHVLVPFELGQSEEESDQKEVNKVIELVLEHANSHPDESLGVITMGISHAQKIETALEEVLKERPDLDSFFNEDNSDHFFVKNIEQVQGDERDAIILSIGYTKEPNGNLPHNFGPLTHQGGERRLNVAVTRARQRMILVSSFEDRDIDLERSNAEGVKLLRSYLIYANSGIKRQELLDTKRLNPIEKDIFDSLANEGIPLIANFGFSEYKIDMVAKHPTKARYVLAIECDGESYASTPTAKERDRLREQQLSSLGWKFHRIWLLDWINNKEQEIERVKKIYEDTI
ncbi:MAG: DUF4011 domain-containing protein [Leptospiraceae bacterium]|nr:DUF4011 domain-containing protein [Leptospiraceae bacterium]